VQRRNGQKVPTGMADNHRLDLLPSALPSSRPGLVHLVAAPSRLARSWPNAGSENSRRGEGVQRALFGDEKPTRPKSSDLSAAALRAIIALDTDLDRGLDLHQLLNHSHQGGSDTAGELASRGSSSDKSDGGGQRSAGPRIAGWRGRSGQPPTYASRRFQHGCR